MSCGVGHRCGLDLALLRLWLWLWPAAVKIRPLAWELPYDASAALKRKKKKKEKKKKHGIPKFGPTIIFFLTISHDFLFISLIFFLLPAFSLLGSTFSSEVFRIYIFHLSCLIDIFFRICILLPIQPWGQDEILHALLFTLLFTYIFIVSKSFELLGLDLCCLIWPHWRYVELLNT